ncbi:MAG: hypothetical protein JW785_02530 [Acidimicrobiia bacterium]|nr:hypothetical protein [Acidimicrobiia bacterium]
MSIRVRKAWMIVGGIALALVVAVGAVLFAFRDTATSVDEEEIGLTVVTGGGAPGDYGLYTYATTGYETTDALAGGRHDYPTQTYLTIQPGGCGSLVRWQALEERYEEWDICPDGTLAGFASFHEWFRVANTDVFECPEPMPIQGEPGETWTAECLRVSSQEAGEGTHTLSYEVIGTETLVVGGEEVETRHVRISTLETGDTEGYANRDIWYLPGTNLLVRWVEQRASTTQSRIGEVDYAEQFEVLLTSLRPAS